MKKTALWNAFGLLTLLALMTVLPAGASAADTAEVSSIVYTLDTDGVDSGVKYLIASGSSGTVGVFTNRNGEAADTGAVVADKRITLSDDTEVGWTTTKRYANSSAVTMENRGMYLAPGVSALLADSVPDLNVRSVGKGEYQLFGPKHWLRYNKKWSRNTEAASVWLYALTAAVRSDSVVLDYGLPVELPVLDNDTLGDTCALAGVGRVEDIPEGGFSTSLSAGFTAQSLNLEYGAVTLNGEYIRYTPDARFLHLTDGERFAYAVSCPGGYAYATVTVFPATGVCYEEDFLDFSRYTPDGVKCADDWNAVGEHLERTQTAGGGPYGYDPAYTDTPGFSMGGARMAHVCAGEYARAAFSFTGTGFDLIGLTGNTTGMILVDIDREGERVKSVLVDSFYAGSAPGQLYQVPLVSVTGLEHGKYDVTVTAAYTDSFDRGQYGDGGYDFYLDALRVYGQARSESARNAHLADGEGWPEYIKLRELLLNGGSAEGGLFIDGAGSASLSEYAAYGPKNEVYLAPGQAMVFDLALEGEYAAVRLGLKSLGGSTSCRIFHTQGTGTARTITIDTAADLSYDITQLAEGTVVVTNTGDALLSLTNIRITRPADPNQI